MAGQQAGGPLAWDTSTGMDELRFSLARTPYFQEFAATFAGEALGMVTQQVLAWGLICQTNIGGLCELRERLMPGWLS